MASNKRSEKSALSENLQCQNSYMFYCSEFLDQRKSSLVHNTQVLTEGHWRAIWTVLLATDLDNWRIPLPKVFTGRCLKSTILHHTTGLVAHSTQWCSWKRVDSEYHETFCYLLEKKVCRLCSRNILINPLCVYTERVMVLGLCVSVCILPENPPYTPVTCN